MKTFKQYISDFTNFRANESKSEAGDSLDEARGKNSKELKETIDFRLGGSANKGSVIKSFEDLEGGDCIYYYNVRRGKIKFKEYIIEKIGRDRDAGWSGFIGKWKKAIRKSRLDFWTDDFGGTPSTWSKSVFAKRGWDEQIEIYSTRELSDKEIAEIASKFRKDK